MEGTKFPLWRGVSGVRGSEQGSGESRQGRPGRWCRTGRLTQGVGLGVAAQVGQVVSPLGLVTGRPEEEPGPDPGCSAGQAGTAGRGSVVGNQARSRAPSSARFQPAANAFPRLCCHRVKAGETGEGKEPRPPRPRYPNAARQGCRGALLCCTHRPLTQAPALFFPRATAHRRAKGSPKTLPQAHPARPGERYPPAPPFICKRHKRTQASDTLLFPSPAFLLPPPHF